MKKTNLGNRFRATLKKTTGESFFGTIFKPTITNEKGDVLEKTARILKTTSNADVNYGDVIIATSGSKFICADNGEGEVKGYSYKTFKLFLVDAEWTWKRLKTTLDPVTNQPVGNGYEDLGSLYVSSEPDGEYLGQFKVPDPKYTVVVNEEVLLDDLVNENYRVTKVDKRSGVWQIETI